MQKSEDEEKKAEDTYIYTSIYQGGMRRKMIKVVIMSSSHELSGQLMRNEQFCE